MNKSKMFSVAATLCLMSAGCAGPANRPLVDPSTVRFPLIETGRLEIEGTVVGQPRARDGIVYFTTSEGFLTAVVAPARQVFWRFKADNPVSAGPELGDGQVLIRDEGNVLYALDTKGSLVFKKQLDEVVTSAAREDNGRIYFGTAGGKILALDLSTGGAKIWERKTAAPITSGPVPAGDLVIFGAADGRLLALNRMGTLAWEFAASGKIAVDPVEANGRLYFGTEDRFLYCLRAATGKKIWSRRLQGAPVHPALVRGRRLVIPASNSVVYFLSERGGSILSWEAVPSRIIRGISAVRSLLLISSATLSLTAHDLATGKRVGQHLASEPLMAGALWVPPFVVLFEGDDESGRQRLVFLKPRPAAASVASAARSPGN